MTEAQQRITRSAGLDGYDASPHPPGYPRRQGAARRTRDC